MTTRLGWRTANLGTQMFVASGRAIAIKLAAVHAAGFADVTAAQLALFHGLDAAGTRMVTLAARARLSKASVAELADRVEAAGLVVRRLHPSDGRGRVIAATPAGKALLRAVARGSADVDSILVACVGGTAAARLHDALGRYVGDDGGARLTGIARRMGLAAARFTAAVAADLAQHGLAVTPALLGMIRHLDANGSRLTDLALAARMTKPAMRELVDRGERLGFVARCHDPADRRARRIVLTPDGVVLLAAVRGGVVAAEAEFGVMTGVAADDLCVTLARFTSADFRIAA